MSPLKLHCEWDSAKAVSNFRKHRVRFTDAAAVFDDPLALTRHDGNHGGVEERWITVGQGSATLVLVIHTLEEIDAIRARVRIISARRPTADERRQYESGKYRIEEPTMNTEHDVSKWERGKFYREGAVLMLPFYLEAGIFARLTRLAADAGVPATDLAGEMLSRAMEEMDAHAGVDDGG